MRHRIAKTATWDITPAFDEYAKSLILSQRALIAGNEDAADALCDAMDAVASDLTPSEIERLSGLAGDLYMLSGRETYLPSDMTLAKIDELGEIAFRQRDGETLLHLMRCAGPHSIKGWVAFLRAKAYDYVGYIPAAIEFAREADRLILNDPVITAQMLGILFKGDDIEEFRTKANKAIDRYYTDDNFVVHATSLVFVSYSRDDFDVKVANDAICVFRRYRSSIPTQIDHGFRRIPIRSERSDAGIGLWL